VFRAAAGVYDQPPFYRELRRYDGTLNTAVKAQRSIQGTAGFDYNFSGLGGRPFRWTTEAYYKAMTNVNPYDVENVRVRYYGNNDAKAYAESFAEDATFTTVFGNINLNSLYYTYETSFEDLRVKTLIIHEARHLQQGMKIALSVYGELDAWQLEFGIYHRIKRSYPHPAIEELMNLPLEYDRTVLKRAAHLMQAYAGKGYRADLLPLFPLGKEIKYQLIRR